MYPTECEVLAHVTAASGARDDKRYTSIAQGILDFQPVSITKVSEVDFIFTSSPSTAAQTRVDRGGSSVNTRTHPSVHSEIPRPRTAPAATFVRENFELSSPKGRRRAHSQTSSSNSSDPVFQASTSRSPQHDIGTRIIGSVLPESSENGLVATHRHFRKRLRLTGPENEQPIMIDHNSAEPTDPATPRDGEQTAPTSTTKVGHRTDSPSVPSTVSPSQPLYWTKIARRSSTPKPRRSRSQPAIDVTTPARHSRPASQPKTSQHTSLGSLISQLPNEVRGPNPKGGQARYKTHLTTTLQKLAVRVPLSKHFRPAFVARDVNVLERGFWEFSVQIVNDLGTRRSRRTSADHSVDRPHAAQWAEKEFIQFWQNVSRFVSEGKAGWGTAMVKEAAEDGTIWNIRIFTWGEVLGHIWLVLWVLSDKATGRIYMHWVAGDGSVIVKMSGAKHKDHRTWIKKGPAKGEGGVWGIAEDLPAI
ncbi:hypothetical protein EDD36DRAFT_209161 [Exophiala viscosa]|uniref:Uncharacterized protein n=1 Tax=Exophiala viscosa TaxID=2486360 RepID=A0AAN6DWA7_9EURO|nr:hypothetical protein EDD36DRAFT_209161 [Exophiala viscosa]